LESTGLAGPYSEMRLPGGLVTQLFPCFLDTLDLRYFATSSSCFKVTLFLSYLLTLLTVVIFLLLGKGWHSDVGKAMEYTQHYSHFNQ